MKKIKDIFENEVIDNELLAQVEKLSTPVIQYVIAMTPRSGSSLLCDIMKNTNLMGRPGEILPLEFIPNILKNAPAKNPDDYMKNALKVLQTNNGISGLKASWFQFNNFCGAMQNRGIIRQYKYIYLIRRDIEEQAVSLYKATESSVFHTNISHGEDAVSKLKSLEYDFDKIKHWYEHIALQEKGWQNFFTVNKIFPLYITYEEIEEDVLAVVKRIANYLGLDSSEILDKASESIFKKLGNRESVEWAAKFKLEYDAEKRQE